MNLFNYVCSLLKRHSLTEFGIQNESDFVLPDVVTEDVDDDDEYFKNLIVRVVETKSHIVQELLVKLFFSIKFPLRLFADF